MQDTKQLRISYNNEWPIKFLFPVEQQLKKLLDDHNLQQAFIPAKLNLSSDQEFHSLLGHFLEGLDQLPFRPDAAFDAIWKALDAEFFRVKDEACAPQHESRFESFLNKVSTDSNTCKAFYPLANVIPMQTCEFAAKRIIKSKIEPDQHSEQFLKRVKSCLGNDLYVSFLSKYEPLWSASPEEAQRKSGAFLRRLVLGEELDINSIKFSLTSEKIASFLISIIMPQFRNERFHGTTFPPFRSSVAKLKTYAHGYFILQVAYALLLEVFLYRNFGVIDQNSVEEAVNKNRDIFLKLFDRELKK
ncbi:hypothetical protein [Duganella sp. BJB476]|uniref:hypothetical protein n=1 Tax=Duganella sp. BJB476 TaxID=1871176 RepID=UPI0011C171DE|nr:hypothetical protein [Duganella sp. BJB476]